MKREQEARELEVDELRNVMNNNKGALEQKILQEKQILRDSLDNDCMDINNRLDKMNMERMNDLGDIQVSFKKINYIYNLRCQKCPRHFVPILRWSGKTPNKTCFVTFVTKLKMEDHMFPFFNLCPPHGESVLKLRDIILLKCFI